VGSNHESFYPIFVCDGVGGTLWTQDNRETDSFGLLTYIAPLINIKYTEIEILDQGSTEVIEGQTLVKQPRIKVTTVQYDAG
jgi:hypothetical protein